MRVGYSFWGFIGPGILDTPDGGRSFRRTVLRGLMADHEVILLQPNRDLFEAGDDLTDEFTWDPGLPKLDALFLEWRWPLPGRNTTPCGSPGHTCDLHRQERLLAHYTHGQGTRTLIWDLDRVLSDADPIRAHSAVTVLEPALKPTPGALTLTTPVDDRKLDNANPGELVDGRRPWSMVYVGNQYDRDAAFDRYFAPAAYAHPHRVAGKWMNTTAWPHVNFTGRIGFTEGQELHRAALTTVLLLPKRYAAFAHMTQRLPEAVLAGCIPIAPTDIREIERFVPTALHVTDSAQVAETVSELDAASLSRRADLLAECLQKLDLFRASTHTVVINSALQSSIHATVSASPQAISTPPTPT